MDKRGDMERLPRFLEIAEKVNLVLALTSPESVITVTDWYGAQNNYGTCDLWCFYEIRRARLD